MTISDKDFHALLVGVPRPDLSFMMMEALEKIANHDDVCSEQSDPEKNPRAIARAVLTILREKELRNGT